jgi:RHS repeat-associated protein
VWLGDTPVATLRPNGGSSIAIYYVHADQLGAPRSITRPSDNAIVWRWDADPYGTAVANQNPSGIGTFVYNLRFPGQYYQSETGLDYNYERDYDPNAGRYVESDPIGLFGGSFSTYAYVGGNPVSRTDLFGLMCTPGFGCYTTPAEAAAAQSGNYLGYYQLACAGGDGYACFAEHIAANDNEWGHLATDRLLEALGKEGICGVAADAIVDEIRTELADAYAAYLPNDPAKAILPDADAIAAFHADVFANYGLPSSTFGGTPLGSAVGVIGAGIWCPNCGLPHTVHPMH